VHPLGEGGDGDVDQPVGAVQSAPQIVVLAIGAAEEGAEAVELDALQVAAPRRSDRGRVVRRDAVDLDGIESSSPSPWSSGRVAMS
jgi:hypothetical protein